MEKKRILMLFALSCIFKSIYVFSCVAHKHVHYLLRNAIDFKILSLVFSIILSFNHRKTRKLPLNSKNEKLATITTRERIDKTSEVVVANDVTEK